MVEENNVQNQPQQQPQQTQAAQESQQAQPQAAPQPTNTQTETQPGQSQEQSPADTSSKEEQIGFHKGSLSTLAKEREELSRIVGIVEQLMQMHIKSLKDLGVDLQQQAQTTKGTQDNKPIEDLVN